MSTLRTHRFWLPVVVNFLIPIPVQAAPSPCDPLIEQNVDHPEGYRIREGQICEGIYATEVSSLGLTLASFTGPVHGIDMTQRSRLVFRWQTVASGEVRLRADSLRPKFYYRMDAVRPAGQHQLSWVNSIPAHHQLRTSEFGVFATQEDVTGTLIYLPLRVSQDGSDPAPTPYQVTVISGAEVEEIYWSLAMEGSDEFLVYDRNLDRKPYVANQPVTFQLDQVVEPGGYLLTVGAELSNGLSDSIQVPFLHSR